MSACGSLSEPTKVHKNAGCIPHRADRSFSGYQRSLTLPAAAEQQRQSNNHNMTQVMTHDSAPNSSWVAVSAGCPVRPYPDRCCHPVADG